MTVKELKEIIIQLQLVPIVINKKLLVVTPNIFSGNQVHNDT